MNTAHLELKPSDGEPVQLHGLLKPDLDSANPVPDDYSTTGSADERR